MIFARGISLHPPCREGRLCMVYESYCTDDTKKIGFELAKKAAAGDVYCLIGELGAGKTVFAKGFARGLGIDADVTSPTFTILNEYRESRLSLFHFDLYRMGNPYELFAMGYEEYFFGDGVTLVEWPENAGNLIPDNSVHIRIETDYERSPEFRRITVQRGRTVW